jgi:hypothetical protein
METILFIYLATYLDVVILFLLGFELFKLATYGGTAHTPKEAAAKKQTEKAALADEEKVDEMEIKTEHDILGHLVKMREAARAGEKAMKSINFDGRLERVIEETDILDKLEKREAKDATVLKRLHANAEIEGLIKEETDLVHKLDVLLKEIKTKKMAVPPKLLVPFLATCVKIVEHLIKINGIEEAEEKAEEAEETAEDKEARRLEADELAKLGDTEHILGYLRNFAIAIAHKVDHPDNQVSMDDMKEANVDIQKIVPMLKKLRDDNDVLQEDEKKLKKIIPDKVLKDEFDQEKNLIELLLKLIVRLNKAVKDDHHGDTAHYIEKVLKMTAVLINLNKETIRRLEKDESV